MHILIGIIVVAGLLAFVWGEDAARIFIGAILSCSALFILWFVGSIAYGVMADDPVKPTTTIRMGSDNGEKCRYISHDQYCYK